MDYFDFLNQRRKLMANCIKRYYENYNFKKWNFIVYDFGVK